MIGIIGGSGFESLLSEAEKKNIETPYGAPSDTISIGMIGSRKIAFLPRHGSGHTIMPHKINFKANIHALREAGCERIIGICAVGSLREDFMPGDFVVPDQFIDFGKDVTTFYEGSDVCHVSMADPFCPDLSKAIREAGKELGIIIYSKGTYAGISGPQFSTRAASKMYRSFADIIGMTGVPEAILCREKEVCFSILASVTDYDVWNEKPVDTAAVKRAASESTEKIKKILTKAVMKIHDERACACRNALKDARF